MVENASPVPPDFPKPPPTPTAEPQKKPHTHGEMQTGPMTFLGMHFDADQSAKLWTVIVQTIGHAIQHDKEKALKAMKKFRDESEGKQTG